MNLFTHIDDVLRGKTLVSKPRAPQWPALRLEHLAVQPVCQVCGGNKNLVVHHIIPFHIYPEGELDPKNLITLCESWKNGLNCHLLVGHLGNFRSYNEFISSDVRFWNARLVGRPVSLL